MIYVEALLDHLLIVVRTTAFLATVDQTGDELLFRHFETYDRVEFAAALLKQFLQSLGLRDCTRETVEDNAVFGFGVFKLGVENIDHEFVGNQVALRNERVGHLAEMCTA